MVGYHQTNQKTDTGKTLTRWPVLVDHNNAKLCGVQTLYLTYRKLKNQTIPLSTPYAT